MYNQFTKWQECYNTAQQSVINKAWYGIHNVNLKKKISLNNTKDDRANQGISQILLNL